MGTYVKIRDSMRRLETVRGKVRESQRKSEKVRESMRTYETIREGQIRVAGGWRKCEKA